MNDIEILEEFKSRTILYSDVYAMRVEELKKIQRAIENLLKERQEYEDERNSIIYKLNLSLNKNNTFIKSIGSVEYFNNQEMLVLYKQNGEGFDIQNIEVVINNNRVYIRSKEERIIKQKYREKILKCLED